MLTTPRWLRATCIPLLALLLPSCREPVGPGSAAIEGLKLELSLTPAAVKRHESFEAELVIRNPRSDTVTLTSGCSTLAWIGLYREGKRVSARGTNFGCLAVVTAFKIPPRGERTWKWTVTAEDESGNAIPPGIYVFRVELAGLTDLERVLQVR